jgi:DNA polymerase III subunit gamma/tau
LEILEVLDKISPMSHVVLYRKYRPGDFDQVIGQEHIVSVLKRSIETSNVSHAYLFSGSRGTGKTTIARIFAKALGTSKNDLYEIDAASNNGVDDVRELRENIRTLPFDSKYKVYILDEVHMLSKGAFNALLKTLEEPPEHVIFILATTELEKVPDTIISRCQTFSFSKPTENDLSKMAVHVAKEEGYELEESAGELIALLGDGSFRDTHSALEKVLTFSKSKKITTDHVEEITGAPSRKIAHKILLALAGKDLDKAIKALGNISSGSDMKIFMRLILHLFRMGMIARISPSQKEDMFKSLAGSDAEVINKILESSPDLFMSKNLAILLEMVPLEKYAFIPQIPLELAFIKILGHDSEANS